jgi:ketosteroid isomerase-like protein
MNSRWIVGSAVVWFLVCAGGATGAAGKTSTSAAYSDEMAIRGLIDAYTKSVSAADTTLAATILAQTPDVSFIHPMGHEHGWEAIKVNVYEQLMGQTFSERKLLVKDLTIHCYGDTAWAEFYWDFAAKLRKDGTPLTTHGRETQIYRKLGDTWRLVHVHYSGLPVLGER